MALDVVSSLIVGEVGTSKNDQISKSVSTIELSLSTTGVSQLDFSVNDPGFVMHNAGYFVIRRKVRFQGDKYEIAAIEVNGDPRSPDSVDVTCRLEAIQKMKRAKGNADFGAISPTAFAESQAKQYGLGFFGQGSKVSERILRVSNDQTDESTWDVLRRLANELQYSVYEADGILYFASEKFILQKQPDLTVKWPSPANATYYLHEISLRRSDDDPLGGEGRFDVDRTNGTKIRPGMAIEVDGVEYFSKKFLVTNVEYELFGEEPVQVRARTLEDSTDVGCESKTFKRGSRGDCVKRIQQAVGATADGIFGPKTEAAVKSFQSANGLSPTGVVDKATWEAISNS